MEAVVGKGSEKGDPVIVVCEWCARLMGGSDGIGQTTLLWGSSFWFCVGK